MAVSLKEFIEESGVKEEVEDELAGISKLSWDFTNFSENIKLVRQTLHVFFVHISDELNRINELRRQIQKSRDELIKFGGPYKEDPWYELYESNEMVLQIWFKVVGYLALEVDILDKVVSHLVDLLSQAKSHGLLKAKVETELEILNTLKQNFIETMKVLSDKVNESNNRLVTVLEQLLQQQKGQVDLSPLISRINQLEAEIEALRLRMENSAGFTYPSNQPQPSYPTQSPTLQKRELSSTELVEEIERLVRDEGITDRVEIAKRLGVSPMRVSLAGFKEIVKKYSKKVNEPTKIEESKENGTIGFEEEDINEIGENEF